MVELNNKIDKILLVPIKITHHFFNYNTHKLQNQTQFHQMKKKTFNFP